MKIIDLGTLRYREAWALQQQAHAEVLDGGEERIFLVEHPPVITFGRRPGVDRNLIASDEQLAKLGVEVVPSDRGGDITFHGPGQLVAYPILKLINHHLSVGGYVRRLEQAVIETLQSFGVAAQKDVCAVGVWVPNETNVLAKVCAIGVRISRGVSLHGLALNVTTDLNYFNLIVPCGLVGRPVTSLQKLLGERALSMADVKPALARLLVRILTSEHPTENLVDTAPAGRCYRDGGGGGT